MSFKFLLSRHSESAHNLHKNEARSSTTSQEEHYKETALYKKIKYDPKLIDLTDIDVNQIKQNKKMFGMQSVSIIIVSPLNRCLQTAKMLSQGHQNIQIIVQPLLTSRISSAWSIGRSLKQKMQEYKNFNFDFVEDQQINWTFQLLDKHTKSRYNKKDYSPESLLEFISEGHAEPYQNIMNRVRKFKGKLKKIYIQRSGNKKILLISHSCTLKTILATEINKKGKAVAHLQFYHCQPLYVTEEYLMKGTILHPQIIIQKKQEQKLKSKIIE